MEYWDIYDRDRNLTGRTVRRGDALKDGEYHIVVQVWITDGNGRWMMTKRHPDKPYGRLWEPTAGSVTAGEDTLAGALREVREEIGITLDPAAGTLFRSIRCDRWKCPGFLDVYVFVQPFDRSDVIMQEGEVIGAEWMDEETVLSLIAEGQFIRNNDLSYMHEIFRRWGRQGGGNE